MFLDGHTKPEPGAIARLIEDVEQLKGEAVVTPAIAALDVPRWKNAASQIGHGYFLDLEEFHCGWLPLGELRGVWKGPRKFYESPALIGCALAVGRELYENLGGFDPHMRYWGVEDLDFGLKSWLMGCPILHDPDAVIGHRFRAAFDNFSVPMEHLLANQLRMARKNFTEVTWSDWVDRCRARHVGRLPEHPEGLWALAWELFQADRASVEHERTRLLGHRWRDEFWYAERFGLEWPRLASTAAGSLPQALFAEPSPSPSPPPCPRVVEVYVQASDTARTKKIPSVLPAAQKPKDHFVTVKGNGDVILEAALDPPDACDQITWGAIGAQIVYPAIDNNCTAKISRAVSAKIPVYIKCGDTTLWQGIVWVVWSTPSHQQNPPVFGPYVGTVPTNGDPDLQQPPVGGLFLQFSTNDILFTITPSEVITDSDIPNLKGSQTPGSEPDGDQLHFAEGAPLKLGIDAKWDHSRQVRVKIINPAGYTKSQLPYTPPGAWVFNNIQAGVNIPVTYPASDVVGNDDFSTNAEDNDPYNTPYLGQLEGYDTPDFGMRNSTGADGDTLEQRLHAHEFARLELLGSWFRISDFVLWRVHQKFKHANGQWQDDGSNSAWDNNGF
ncbi:MAG TPA: galactosyltransferase-related protein [Pirellulales bacterium]|nr:galactosyltransferase-related protein [Pirellulales bacterium]